MRNLFEKLMITILITAVGFNIVICAKTTLHLTPREFNAKGWYILCQPCRKLLSTCNYCGCELLCFAETADAWLDCIFADPNGFPCMGKPKEKSNYNI